LGGSVPRGFVYGRAEGTRSISDRRAKGALRSQARSDGEGVPADNYGERLLKYVPAEVLAFFLAAAGKWGSDNTFLIVALVVAVVLTPVVLYATSPSGLRWYAFVLAIIAFGVWAIGTSTDTDRLLGISSDQAPFVLTVGAFVIPTVDKALGRALHG
jgi:hypothetical protein